MDYPVRTPKQLGEVLRGFRGARELTQAELAGRIGLMQKAVSAMERAPGRTSVERLFRVLSGLDIEVVLRAKKSSPGKGEPGW